MRKTLKKTLCFFLAVVMLLGTMTVSFSALDFGYGMNYFFKRSEATNTAVVLDKVDQLLAEKNIYEKVTLVEKTALIPEVAITLDLTSINGVCKTVDMIRNIFTNPVVWVTAKLALGDVGDADFLSWQTGMKRGAQDQTIIYELIELAAANSTVLSKLIDGSIDLGIVDRFINIKELMGDQGVSGYLKKLFVGLVYDENNDRENYDRAYQKALTDFDSFVCDDVLKNLLTGDEGLLPGLTLTSETTFDTIIKHAFDIIWDKYIAPMIAAFDIDWTTSSNPTRKKIDAVLELKGSRINTNLPFSESKKFTEQINDILGFIAKQIVPGYPNWQNGGFEKVSGNITALLKYIAQQIGINTASKSNGEIAYGVFYAILTNIDEGELLPYAAGIESCQNISELMTALLRNIATMNGVPVTASKSADIGAVLGDILVHSVSNTISLGYEDGSGVNIWKVLDDLLNIFLYDVGLAKAWNLTTPKSADVFTKLDELIVRTRIFGENPPADYKCGVFFPELLNAISSFDINRLFEMVAVRFMNDFGDETAMRILYNALYNLIKTSFNQEFLVPCATKNPLQNAFTNESLKQMVANFLPVLNKEKQDIIPPIIFLVAALLDDKLPDVQPIPDSQYAGYPATPKLNVVHDGKTLREGTDYRVEYANNNAPGVATATLIGKGDYSGTKEISFNLLLGSINNVAATVSGTSATVTWNAVPGADKYEVYFGSDLKATTSQAFAVVAGLTPGKEYNVKVRALTNSGYSTDSYSITVKCSIVNPALGPANVGAISSSVTENSVTLSWQKADRAVSYEVYVNDVIKAVTADTFATIPNLTPETVYTAKVRAKNENGASAFSSIEFKTLEKVVIPPLEAVSSLNATAQGSKIVLKWNAVEGADGYEILQGSDDLWRVIGKTARTEYTIENLAVGSSYQFRVRAYNSNVTGDFSPAVTATPSAEVSALKASASSKAVTLRWKEYDGATGYIVEQYSDGAWKIVADTKENSFKVSGLSSNKAYQFRVSAYSKTLKSILAYSKEITAKTAIAAPKGLAVSATKSTGFTLTWKKVSGAKGYAVYRNESGKWVKIGTTTQTKIALSGLKANTKMKLRVKAFDASKVYSDYSASIYASTGPKKVKNLSASAKTKNTVTLKWSKADGAEKYVVYRFVNGKWKAVATVKNTTVTDKKLKANTTYKYRVQAFKTVSGRKTYSNNSAILKVTTKK